MKLMKITLSLFVLFLLSGSFAINSKIKNFNKNVKFASSFLELKSLFNLRNENKNSEEFISELGLSNINQNEFKEEEEENSDLFVMNENKENESN